MLTVRASFCGFQASYWDPRLSQSSSAALDHVEEQKQNLEIDFIIVKCDEEKYLDIKMENYERNNRGVFPAQLYHY